MSDPADELRALTHALRRHVRRRAVLGDRRLPRWTPPAPVEPAPAPGPKEDRVEAGSSPVGAPFPDTWGSTPREKSETEARVSHLTELARGCPELPSLQALLANCNACSLCQTRTQTVFMDGTGPARVMFVGEAPGFHEDQQGTPFVGRAGQLLTDIIEKGMGLPRSEVVIANVLKCRPPDNRDPLPVEKRLCTTWLDRQIELVQPEVLIALGRHAAGHLLGNDNSMARLRGRVWLRDGRKVIATYHPAYLLRSPSEKKECWKDIQLAMAQLSLAPPGNPPAAGR